jgi:hypothetical protein
MPFLPKFSRILDRCLNILINGQNKTEKPVAVFHYVEKCAFEFGTVLKYNRSFTALLYLYSPFGFPAKSKVFDVRSTGGGSVTGNDDDDDVTGGRR